MKQGECEWTMVFHPKILRTKGESILPSSRRDSCLALIADEKSWQAFPEFDHKNRLEGED
jgi:hypothetical protein